MLDKLIKEILNDIENLGEIECHEDSMKFRTLNKLVDVATNAECMIDVFAFIEGEQEKYNYLAPEYFVLARVESIAALIVNEFANETAELEMEYDLNANWDAPLGDEWL